MVDKCVRVRVRVCVAFNFFSLLVDFFVANCYINYGVSYKSSDACIFVRVCMQSPMALKWAQGSRRLADSR